MIRVAIIGCGKIADSHAEQIVRIPDAQLVGACDQEILMAKQLAERFAIGACYSDVKALLESTGPDVVHITTPPQSHFALGKFCLEAGCHVYMEKPFTVDSNQASQLIETASKLDLKITVGHDYQFTRAKRLMRQRIASGLLGGPPVHMESYHCYELGTDSYVKALLGDKKHWVRMLPGTLMHNNISHGICSIAEYLEDEDPVVQVHGHTSPILQRLGENAILDEARILISAHNGATAFFTFSTQMRPLLHQFRIYGPRNSMIVDHDQQTCILIDGKRRKSYLEKFVSPAVLSGQYLGEAMRNVSLFLQRDFHMKSRDEIFDRAILSVDYPERSIADSPPGNPVDSTHHGFDLFPTGRSAMRNHRDVNIPIPLTHASFPRFECPED